MTLEQQLAYIRSQMPEAWEYLHSNKAELPKFNDDDDVVSYWGGTLPVEKEED